MIKNPKVSCKQCGTQFTKKHPSQLFHNKKCKDRYHNLNNPRGKFAHLAGKDMPDDADDSSWPEGWDEHKDGG